MPTTTIAVSVARLTNRKRRLIFLQKQREKLYEFLNYSTKPYFEV